jgi:hypothetical protein
MSEDRETEPPEDDEPRMRELDDDELDNVAGGNAAAADPSFGALT